MPVKKQKSESRKLAELIARQRGIKVKSAQSWLSRVAAGKVKKPKYELSTYAKRKVKQYVASKRKAAPAPAPAPAPAIEAEYVPKQRVNFDFPHLELFKAYGTFRDGSAGGERRRLIRVNLRAGDVNAILNADNFYQAGEVFLFFVPYLEEVIELEYFEFRGRTYGPEFFDD